MLRTSLTDLLGSSVPVVNRGHEDELEADAPALAEVAATPVVYAGQGAGTITARRPAADVVADLGAGAEALLRRWG